MFDFRTPLFLILLAVIPVLIFVQRGAQLSTAKWRKRVTFFLRGAALLCAILALANLHRTHQEQRLALVFLIDASESIQSTQYEEASEQMNATVAKLKPTDKFGIIGFAREAVVLLEIRQKQDQPTQNHFYSVTGSTHRTDNSARWDRHAHLHSKEQSPYYQTITIDG